MRPNWSGLVPVPGDGRYEWDGYLPIKALPHVLNPEKGFFNTSNNYLIPPGWPFKEALHYLWADPYRAASVAEFLGSGRLFTVADMVELQNSDLSIPARSVTPLLAGLDLTNPESRQAAGSPAPLGLRARQGFGGRRHLRNVAAPPARERARARGAQGGADVHRARFPMTKIIGWLEAPDGRFGADPIAGRNELLE